MAGGLAAVGVIAALVVSFKEHEEEVADEAAEEADTSRVATDVAAQAPLALLGALFTMPGGPSSALKVAQVLGRNFPLVLLLVLVGALFWPSKEGEDTESVRPRPNGFEPPAPRGLSLTQRHRAGNRLCGSGSDGSRASMAS
jgi:hypothetical protein